MNGKKWIAGAMATSVLAAALAGCGTAKETPKDPTTPPQKQAATELSVWTHLTPPEAEQLTKASLEWTKKTGTKVKILVDQSDFQAYAAAASAGKGPDLMYGLAHDNLGTFQKAGLLDPVPDGLINDADFEKLTIDAVSYDGKKFALPISYEAIAMFYNKALVKEVPKTWAEFATVATAKGFKYNLKDFYMSYGFIAGSGGYVFKDKGNGALDPKDVGLNNDGAKAGLQLLSDFINTNKWMPNDIDENMGKAEFQAGKIAFYLSGPWDAKGFADAKLDFGVTTVPTLPNGKPFTPFVGVQAAFVNASSKYKAEAWDLIKYLNDNAAEALLKTGNRIPAQKKFADKVKADAVLAGFSASALNGTPMPNIPAMSTVWVPAKDAINLTVMKQATPDQAASNAVKAINEAVAALK
jgi:arabinogalactan oligomer/maltooligosaccharide transport system substrate-binding protein